MVKSPNSSGIQRASDEFSWKHFCTKLIKTTFIYHKHWIKKKFQHQTASLDQQMEFHMFFHTVTFCLLLYGLRFRQFHWILIVTELTCRDSNMSVHNKCQLTVSVNNTLVSDLAARTFANISSYLALSCFPLCSCESKKKKRSRTTTAY